MISKFLEKKVALALCENGIGLRNQNEVELEYYIVESNVDDVEELMGQTVYGIEIVKRVGEESAEIKTVKNLSCCRENAESILQTLAQNAVTPVGLPFILDDLISV